MIGSDLLRGLAVASLFLDGTPSLSHFYAVAVMLGLLRALFQPSLYASLPNVVPQERLVGANALISVTYHAAVMIGPIIGGLLVALAGPTVAFGVNAASFGVSAAFLAGVRLPRRVHPEAGSTPWRELAEGVRYSLDNRLVRWVLAITGLIMIGASIKAPLEPLFVLRTLGRQPAALGLVGGAWGLGMMLGSIGAPAAANRWPRERLLGISAAVVGLCILAVSRAAALPPILLMWLVAGAANAIGTVSYESLLQERTPDALRGRVMAASEAVLDGTFLVGVSLAGWLGETAGIRGAFVVSGVIFLATGVLSHVLLAPSTKRPEAPDVGEEHPDPALEPLSVGSVSGSHESTSGLFPDSWAASASGPAPAREFDPVSVPDGRVEPPPAPPVPEPVAAPAQAVATAARSEWTAYQLTRPISPPRLPRPLSRPLPRRPALRLGRRSASIAAGVAVLVAGGFVLWLRPWQPEPTGLALALERGNTMVFRIEAWSSWTMEPGYAGRLDSELEGLLTVKPLDYKNGFAKTNVTLQAWSLTINGRPVSRPPSPRARIHLSSRGQVLRGAELRLPSPSAPLLLAAAGLSPTLSETLVRPGDSWSGWTHVRLFGGRARVRASGRLLRYEEHGDINAAVVQGTRKIFLKGAPLLGKGKIVVDQTAWIDPETGDVLRSEAVLRVDLRGRALGGRPPIEGTTTLRLLAVS